ncbi:MAG: YeeE/YedE family protein, partial [Candidatus Zixiibacteriota bacterium]
MKIDTNRAVTSKGYVLKGLKKPSRAIASRVYWTTSLLITVTTTIGIVAGDMRPVIAAIYFGLGFAVQRASFCSASMISAVILSRDARGLVAIIVAVLAAMLGFGLMHTVGLITVYPSRVSLIPAAISGLIFGVGMVFAGGCVSGSLFKATEGRWPSVLAVIGIFVGMAMGMSSWGRSLIACLAEIGSSWNPPPNLSPTDGASFSHLATGVALIGLTSVSLVYRRQILAFRLSDVFPSDGRWKPLGVALIVGLLGWAAFLAGPAVGRYYPLGAS